MIGKTLAHYEITSQLGKGGMGEVYQAKDQKLGRDVAIKVLPEEFAKDADRVARFQREAKLLASLNHPNIAAIYGLEESEGTNFLVMELVEGQTLDERIKAGAIPVEEALKLGLQIAEALEAAHEKGVIHRDLKPANIKITPDGKVKVLDFGLAKAFAGEQADLNLSNSPTLSQAATMQGVILGTAAYMSPEQARGKEVDKRADVWAFGVVLFEMLTGKQVFTGDTVSDTLASVLAREPEWQSLPANIHPRIRFLLERCLKKESKNRYSGISDARVEIQEVLSDPSGVFAQPSVFIKPKKKFRVSIPWVAAAIALTAVIIGVAVWILKPSPPPELKQVVRFSHEIPEDQQFYRTINGIFPIAVSPDGTQILYSTTKGLYLLSVNELVARPIRGSDKDSQSLFFSPNGQWIGYFSSADQKLKKISISGGTPVDLCDAQMVQGADWNEDNTIIYSDVFNGIYKVSADGGTPELLIRRATAAPQLLPDGETVMFLEPLGEGIRTVVQSLVSDKRKVLLDEQVVSRYLPSGHFIYGAGDRFFAVPFDLEKLEPIGGAVPLDLSMREFACSDSGTLVYISPSMNIGLSDTAPERTLVWVDREGNEEPLAAPPDRYGPLKISPDGTQIVTGIGPSYSRDILIWDTVRKVPTILTFDEASDEYPLWTPDGQRVVFHSLREGTFGGIYWKKADGTGTAEHIFSMPDRMISPQSLSKDGDILVLTEMTFTPVQSDIGMLSMEGDREREPLLQEKYSEFNPQLSPDGKWMAYVSDESGQIQIYVRPFPQVDASKYQIPNGIGYGPLWSPDGKELFYRNGEEVVAVPVETEPIFKAGNPEILFRENYFSDFMTQRVCTLWDVHPDGKRFLMIKQPERTKEEIEAEFPRKINIILNWFEELKEKVPVE
jgi:serine/threonine protein kinase